MSVLATYQDASGMWHQVLNRPASFEETSCTAMFTLAMAKGVRKGWLEKSYRDKAIRGWMAVQKKVEADGTVHDICRGTEIGFDEAFYFERKRFDQDPRGLGAVIAAGIEVSQLQ
jgi:rhamnogalacturonyl hydrolase YesR